MVGRIREKSSRIGSICRDRGIWKKKQTGESENQVLSGGGCVFVGMYKSFGDDNTFSVKLEKDFGG